MDLKWKILCWRTNSPSLSIGKLSPANLEVKLMYYSDPSKSPWSIVRTNRVQTFKLPHVLIFLIIFDIFWHLENSICRICPFLKKISSHFRILHHFSGEKPRNHRRIGNQAKLLEDGRPRCRAWGSWWWTGTVSKSTKSFGPREGQGHQNEKKHTYCGVEAVKQDEFISCHWCDHKDCQCKHDRESSHLSSNLHEWTWKTSTWQAPWSCKGMIPSTLR